MEREVFEKRINECFDEVIKELRYQINYNIENGIYEHCESVPAYSDVKAVLFQIMTQGANIVGKPCLPSSIRRFNQIKKLVRFNFLHS